MVREFLPTSASPRSFRCDFENDEQEVTKIGTIVSNFVNDEYDIPTFLRNSDDLEPNEA